APTRRIPPLLAADPQHSLFFEFYNAGKKSVIADARKRADRERLRELVAGADVWLDTTPPGEPLPHGLDGEAASAANPRLIDVSLQEAVAGALEETSAAWNGERRIEIRRGPVHWTRVFRTCRCRDGYVMLCLIGDWTTFVGWLTERGFGAELAREQWDDFYV